LWGGAGASTHPHHRFGAGPASGPAAATVPAGAFPGPSYPPPPPPPNPPQRSREEHEEGSLGRYRVPE
jgi:hypothetical protein